ncbi:hypothetical protein [Cryobacterium sp. MLB-32]|nr:hypothetical protein [Cryobacterium sp. MLB-32]
MQSREHANPSARSHRPLAEIDLEMVGMVMSNGEGGYYDLENNVV